MKKLKIEINEVENGYIIQDMRRDARFFVARNPTKLRDIIEQLAVEKIASVIVRKPEHDPMGTNAFIKAMEQSEQIFKGKKISDHVDFSGSGPS